MALAATVDSAAEFGDNSYHVHGTLTLDNSYPTGGWALAGIISGGGAKLEKVEYLQVNAPGYVFSLDRANQKLQVFRQKDPAAAGGADIALPEVGNAVDLSALTPVFYAIGQ